MPELFENFEVNREPIWPRMFRLIGASALLHAVVAACVIFIPPVRDALSVAELFKDTGVVDRPYRKTTIADEDEIAELSTERFHYPEGYFALEQAEATPTPDPFAPKIVSEARFTRPFRFPTPLPSPLPSPSPSPPPKATPSPLIAANSGEASKPAAGPENKSTPESKAEANKADAAQQELEKAAKEQNIDLPKEDEINKRTLKDFAAYASQLKDQGKLNLDQPFEVIIEAEFDANGNLQNPKFTRKAGDTNLVDLSGKLIAALNDSRILETLKKLREDNRETKVVITAKQDQNEVAGTFELEASSIDKARSLSSGFSVVMALGAKAREDKDEGILLKNTKVSSDGKKIIFSFSMPRQAAVEMIKKQLPAASSSPS